MLLPRLTRLSLDPESPPLLDAMYLQFGAAPSRGAVGNVKQLTIIYNRADKNPSDFYLKKIFENQDIFHIKIVLLS